MNWKPKLKKTYLNPRNGGLIYCSMATYYFMDIFFG